MKVPRRIVVLLLGTTVIGVVMGVVLLASGEKVAGWTLIAGSLIGPPSGLLIIRRALARVETR